MEVRSPGGFCRECVTKVGQDWGTSSKMGNKMAVIFVNCCDFVRMESQIGLTSNIISAGAMV
jgi:hypothetical protein